MTYENKIGRGGIEYGGVVPGITVRDRGEPITKSAAIVDGDELIAVATRYGVLHQGKGGRLEVFVPGCFARTWPRNRPSDC